jgi:hypothetical protein
MAEDRGAPRWRSVGRGADRPGLVRVVYAPYETAWAAAWPHLDDWFKPEAFFIGYGGHRFVMR